MEGGPQGGRLRAWGAALGGLGKKHSESLSPPEVNRHAMAAEFAATSCSTLAPPFDLPTKSLAAKFWPSAAGNVMDEFMRMRTVSACTDKCDKCEQRGAGA